MAYLLISLLFNESNKILRKILIWKNKMLLKMHSCRDFHGGTEDRNSPANAGDVGSILGPGRSYMPQSN